MVWLIAVSVFGEKQIPLHTDREYDIIKRKILPFQQRGADMAAQNHRRTRWYDRHVKLGKYLEALRNLTPRERNPIVRKLLDLIRTRQPSLVDENHAVEFPLDLYRRRWYDKEPLLWLLFNALRDADESLRDEVVGFFSLHIDLRKKQLKHSGSISRHG